MAMTFSIFSEAVPSMGSSFGLVLPPVLPPVTAAPVFLGAAEENRLASVALSALPVSVSFATL